MDADEPAPVEVIRPDGTSPFVLTCEHAGRYFPRRNAALGLSESDRRRHIAWDIGAEGVSRRLADHLDATLVLQLYSRLIVDCNRPLENAALIPVVSETTEIIGNCGLDAQERQARIDQIYRPFHETVSRALDTRERAGRVTVFVAVHSFTPVFKGFARPWHFGVMFHQDRRFANALIGEVSAEPDIILGINEPYALTPGVDFTALFHGQDRGLLHTEVEIRQDLIEQPEGQVLWAAHLARWLPAALNRTSLPSLSGERTE